MNNQEETALGQRAPHEDPLQSIKKRVVPTDYSDATVEPLFINFSHGAYLGDDFYLDVGVITLESLEDPGKVGDFAVLTRLVMSRRTMIGLRDQINSLLASTGDTASGS